MDGLNDGLTTDVTDGIGHLEFNGLEQPPRDSFASASGTLLDDVSGLDHLHHMEHQQDLDADTELADSENIISQPPDERQYGDDGIINCCLKYPITGLGDEYRSDYVYG